MHRGRGGGCVSRLEICGMCIGLSVLMGGHSIRWCLSWLKSCTCFLAVVSVR